MLLRANPFEDLAALGEIDGVLLRGRWLDRAELDAVLERLEREGASAGPPTDAETGLSRAPRGGI